MRILITGAAGFLGSHLSDHLLADGHEVIGMDNFVTGNPDNIAHLAGNEKFSFYKRDVSNYIFVPGKVDAILHFASPASPNPQSKSGYFNLPIQTMKAGALGTHNCLGLARAQNARFLLASTSEIYGDPEVHPQVETYAGNVDPVGTRAVYDEAKRFAESLTMAYHRFHNVNTSIVRIFKSFPKEFFMKMSENKSCTSPFFKLLIYNWIHIKLRNIYSTFYSHLCFNIVILPINYNTIRENCYYDQYIQ